MILLIDNYDSFTYNLVHLIGAVDPDITVHRNDHLSAPEAIELSPSAIVLSPGPCTPNEAGICLDLVKLAAEKEIPLLGVCLGHQSIAQTFGAKVVRAPRQMHGKLSKMTHNGEDLFKGLPSPLTATRYHSLTVDPDTMTNDLEVTSHAEDDNMIMGIRVKGLPIFGLQFHPESIKTEYGRGMIQNFLSLR